MEPCDFFKKKSKKKLHRRSLKLNAFQSEPNIKELIPLHVRVCVRPAFAMSRRNRRETRPALFTINLDSDGEEVPEPSGSQVAQVTPHVPPVSVFAEQFICMAAEAGINAYTQGIVTQKCPVITSDPHPEMGLCDLGQPQPPANVEHVLEIEDVRLAVDMLHRDARINSRKAHDLQAQCNENMHNERLQNDRERKTLLSQTLDAQNDSSMWEARTGVARALIEQAKTKTNAEDVEKTEALRARYREALRAANARGGVDAQCNCCYDTAYDAYAVGLQDGKLSQGQIDTLLADFANNPDNRVIFQRIEMMTLCTENHYLCCLCTGALLQKPGPVFSRQIDCPIVGCAGKLPTSGPKSMAGMAHTKEEADQLARHVNFVPGHIAQNDVRPDLARAWLLHKHLIEATNGSASCPGCLYPGTFSEACAHYTCGQCDEEWCAWCTHISRSEAPDDDIRLPGLFICPGALTYAHSKMCHNLLWAVHFITYWHHKTTPLDFCKFVTQIALQNNFHGATSVENGKTVTGILMDNTLTVFNHWNLSVPDATHFDTCNHEVPDCGVPVSNLHPVFARMWGDADISTAAYVERGNFRRPVFHYFGDDRYFGYHPDSLRLISMSVVQFTQHCNHLEDWLQKQIRLFKRTLVGLKLARITEIFEHARLLRCFYECLVPWQVLMAMRVHQLRLDPIYDQRAAGSAAHPDTSYVPFPLKWEMSGVTSVPIFKRVPYFNKDGYREGGNFFMRKPAMGFPFVNPHEISISDLAQAAVVHEQIVEERKQGIEPQAWEFSMEFHGRFVTEMHKYAEVNEAGPMPPKLLLSRGPND